MARQSGKKKLNGYRTSIPTAHFALSLVVIVGVFLLVYVERLQGQAATGMIGMIVGYLFGKGRG